MFLVVLTNELFSPIGKLFWAKKGKQKQEWDTFVPCKWEGGNPGTTKSGLNKCYNFSAL